MVYHGHVRNGVIVLEDDARLPEGAAVRVDVVSNGEKPVEPAAPLYDLIKPLIGSLTDAPEDLAASHDHYLYGAPRRER